MPPLLATPGVGPKALRALSLLSELAYGTPPSYRDLARYSFAHRGKDGHPFPVDQATYDHSIAFLQKALAESRLDRGEKLDDLKRLGQWEAAMKKRGKPPETLQAIGASMGITREHVR